MGKQLLFVKFRLVRMNLTLLTINAMDKIRNFFKKAIDSLNQSSAIRTVLEKNEKLTKINAKLQVMYETEKQEKESALDLLKKSVDKNSMWKREKEKMQKQLDNYGLAIEILMTYVDDSNERRKISNLLAHHATL